MRDFRELKVWEKAYRLTLGLYRATAAFPTAERYGLTSQIRRAGASIPANIAEGCGRNGNPELARFLQIAMGSASELEVHLMLSHDLGFLTDQTYAPLREDLVALKRMLGTLIGKVLACPQQPRNSTTANRTLITEH